MGNKLLTKSLFWGYDIFHRKKLSRMYDAVKEKNNSSEVFDLQKLKKYLRSWDIGDDIHDLPLMTKDDVRNFSSTVPDSSFSSFVYTGGSTGEPLKIPYSKYREILRTASITYYNELAGYLVGDRFLFIRAKKKSKLLQFLRNEVLFIPSNISEQSINKTLRKIIDEKISVIIGYPSVIYEMSLIFNRNNDFKNNHYLKSIITVSEPLEDSKRLFIKDVFNCTLIDRYSNEEVGVIAQQREFGGDYITDQFGVYTEILHPETLRPVSENEIGKVVITDVYNDVIPLVRYDTGDLAIAAEYKKGMLYKISRIAGRESEQIFATDNTPVSSLTLGPYIHQPFSVNNIKCQFQFSQVGKKKYELRIKGNPTELPSGVKKEIIKGLKKVLGSDADIEILFFSDIKPLPSGKRPLYLNQSK
jgi:phenylacetate-CoA ligase